MRNINSRYKRLHNCFICFSKQEDGTNYKCDGRIKNERLPRKKKKYLKKVARFFYPFVDDTGICGQFDLTSCNLNKHVYKSFQPYFSEYPYFKKREKTINLLIGNSFTEPIMITLDREFKKVLFGFYWETDSDYGGSSGVEPFHFQQKGNMWMFDELQGLMKNAFNTTLEAQNITNQKQLLDFFNRNRQHFTVNK